MLHCYRRSRAVRTATLSVALSVALAAPISRADEPRSVNPAGAAPEPAPRSGVGMMVGGGVALGVSTPLLISGLRTAGGTGEDLTGGSGLIVLGMLGVLAGTALLAYGGTRHRQWRGWRAKRATVTPRVSRSGLGAWTAGVTLRF